MCAFMYASVKTYFSKSTVHISEGLLNSSTKKLLQKFCLTKFWEVENFSASPPPRVSLTIYPRCFSDPHSLAIPLLSNPLSQHKWSSNFRWWQISSCIRSQNQCNLCGKENRQTYFIFTPLISPWRFTPQNAETLPKYFVVGTIVCIMSITCHPLQHHARYDFFVSSQLLLCVIPLAISKRRLANTLAQTKIPATAEGDLSGAEILSRKP